MPKSNKLAKKNKYSGYILAYNTIYKDNEWIADANDYVLATPVFFSERYFKEVYEDIKTAVLKKIQEESMSFRIEYKYKHVFDGKYYIDFYNKKKLWHITSFKEE